MRVVIAEDDQWYGEHLARVLAQVGITSAIVGDAIAALDAIDQQQPDLVLLDVFLPGPNGFVLLHELQSHADIGQIPVVLCTQSADALSLTELRVYGVRALLDKTTTTPEEIIRTVKEVSYEHA